MIETGVRTCYACGGSKFHDVMGELICDRCHPPQTLIKPDIIAAPRNAILARMQQARRLNDDVTELFGIEPYQYGSHWGYKYPAPDRQATRWKNADSRADFKYLWLRTRTDYPIYHAPDLLGAIEAAHGYAWLVTEADVWTLRAAGINNAFSFYGENIPSDFDMIGELARMGILHVLLAPDRDVTGMKFGKAVKRALGTILECTLYELPAQMTGSHGYDIGAAWQGYNRPEPFEQWLTTLPQIDIPDEPAEPVTSTPTWTYDSPNADPLEFMRLAIIERLGVQTFNAKGYSKPLNCLFHKDKKPSAAIHSDKGLHCFVCGWHTWKELAEALDIPWQFGHVTETILPNDTEVTGMSREARAILIGAGLTNLARALDVLYSQGRGGEQFTRKQFTDALAPVLSENVSRTAFDNARGIGLPAKSRKSNFCGNFSFFSFITQKGKKTPKNQKGAGRQEILLTIPTEPELNHMLDVSPRTYYGMTEQTLKSPKHYRAECLATRIRQRPGTYAAKTLAKDLEISKPTVRAYCDIAGIERTPNPPKLEELQTSEMAAMPANVGELRKQQANGQVSKFVFLQSSTGRRYPFTQMSLMRAMSDNLEITMKLPIQKRKANPPKVYRAQWQASTYTPREDE